MWQSMQPEAGLTGQTGGNRWGADGPPPAAPPRASSFAVAVAEADAIGPDAEPLDFASWQARHLGS